MLLSIKTKLKLNKNQKTLMAKDAGIARFAYNWGLATWQDLYKDGLKPNKYLLKKFFNNHVKPEFTWIKEKGICQKITQYAFDNLGEAFQRFFKGLSEYPKFKKKGKNDNFTILLIDFIHQVKLAQIVDTKKKVFLYRKEPFIVTTVVLR
jgi:putative transposase